jgi:2-haloacid dehalogenase
MSKLDPSTVHALLFDVFGTVVDWRTSIIDEGRALGKRTGNQHVDWEAFADRWRSMYQPSMERVRSGEREWTLLDTLHRESLDALVEEFGVRGLDEAELERFNLAWHRLKPWPDSPEGLARLRQRFLLVTCSNGNARLLMELARSARLPFDGVLGPSVARAYKPQDRAYLETAALLGLDPGECMMVAAHNADLAKAASLGLRTAFVARPSEHGPHQSRDFEPDGPWDHAADSFLDLASQLGC